MSGASDADLEKLETLAKVAKVMIVFVVISSFVGAIALVLVLNDAWPVIDFYVYDVGAFEGLIIIDVSFFLISTISVACWIFRAHANLITEQTPGADTTPGWAIGWYFVPIANFFKPYQSMKELWQGSVDREIDSTRTAPSLIWLWWLAWLLSSFSGLSEEITAYAVVPYIMSIVSASALFIIIDRVTAAQPTMSVASTFE